MIGYYAQFVYNYADLAAPLIDLHKKESTWQWTEREQSAFESFKTTLTRAPVLEYPAFTRPFLYATDAPNMEFSAVL